MLDGRHGQVQRVDEVLRVHGHAQVLVRPDVAGHRDQLASQQLQQRRLAGTVGANERDAGVEVDAEVDVLVQQLATGVSEGQVRDLQHRRGQLLWVGEPHGQRSLRVHLQSMQGR